MVDGASSNDSKKGVSSLLVPVTCIYLSAHSGDEDYGCHAGEEQDKSHYHTG
jgi:hypothetical protein